MADVTERALAGAERHRGLDPIRAEIDDALRDHHRRGAAARRRLLGVVRGDRDDAMLAAWFVPRCWREIDYVYMLGEQIRRYGVRFERRHVTALARQLLDEAEHYDDVGAHHRAARRDGADRAAAVGRDVEPFLWDCLDRHPLGAIAAWNMSETAATGTLEGIVAAGNGTTCPRS